MRILGQKWSFWAKHAIFRREQNFWYPHIRKPPRHLIRFVLNTFHCALMPRWPKRRKCPTPLVLPLVVAGCQGGGATSLSFSSSSSFSSSPSSSMSFSPSSSLSASPEAARAHQSPVRTRPKRRSPIRGDRIGKEN